MDDRCMISSHARGRSSSTQHRGGLEVGEDEAWRASMSLRPIHLIGRPPSAGSTRSQSGSRSNSRASSRQPSASASTGSAVRHTTREYSIQNDPVYFDFYNTDIWDGIDNVSETSSSRTNSRTDSTRRSSKNSSRAGSRNRNRVNNRALASKNLKKRPKSAPTSFQQQTKMSSPLDFYKDGEIFISDVYPHIKIDHNEERPSTTPVASASSQSVSMGLGNKRSSQAVLNTRAFSAKTTKALLRKTKSNFERSVNAQSKASSTETPSLFSRVPRGMKPLPETFVPENRVKELRRMLHGRKLFPTALRQQIKRHTRELKKLHRKNQAFQQKQLKSVYNEYAKETKRGRQCLQQNKMLLSRPKTAGSDTSDSSDDDDDADAAQKTQRDQRFIRLAKTIGVSKKSIFRSLQDESPLNELLEQQQFLMKKLQERQQGRSGGQFIPTALPARPLTRSRKIRMGPQKKVQPLATTSANWAVLSFSRPTMAVRETILAKPQDKSRW